MESEIIVRKCDKRDLDELSQFAYRINTTIQHSSTFCSNTLEVIHRDIEESISSGNALEGRKEGRLIGVLICYTDDEKNNTDCSKFLNNIGANREINEYALLLKRGSLTFTSWPFTITDLPQEYYKQFIELHDNIFPGNFDCFKVSGNILF